MGHYISLEDQLVIIAENFVVWQSHVVVVELGPMREERCDRLHREGILIDCHIVACISVSQEIWLWAHSF